MTQCQGTGAEGPAGSELHVRCVCSGLTRSTGNHSLQGLPEVSQFQKPEITQQVIHRPGSVWSLWGESVSSPHLYCITLGYAPNSSDGYKAFDKPHVSLWLHL